MRRDFALRTICGCVMIASNAAAYMTWNRTPKPVPIGPIGPMLSCPTRIDLGSHETGQVVSARFEMANRGGELLRLENIRSSCACIGLEQLQADGVFRRVEECQLNPGEVGQFGFRFTVKGRPGQEQLNRIQFSSNDPEKLGSQIDIVVPTVRGLLAEPGTIIFGKQIVGSNSVCDATLYNVGNEEETVVGVSCDDSELACTFEANDPGGTHVEPAKGIRLGKLQVKYTAKSLGQKSSAVRVTLRRQNLDREVLVPVTALTVPSFSFSPDRVLLPRRTEDKWTYRISCLFIANTGPCTISVASLPDGITASLADPAAQATHHRLEVEAAEHVKPGRYTITILVTGDGESSRIELPVEIRPTE
jgi:hypothetical protein